MVLPFENENDRRSYKRYYLPNFQPLNSNKILQCYDRWKKYFRSTRKKNYLRTYDSIRKIAAVQGDDYTTRCFLDYPYLEKYNLIAIDWSKQQKVGADPNAMQQFNFTGNLEEANTIMFFIIEEAKEPTLDFSKGPETILWFFFFLTWYQYKMTNYNTLNINFSNSQLYTLKPGIINDTGVTLNLSSKYGCWF